MKYVSNNGEVSKRYRGSYINFLDGSKIKNYNKLIDALKKIGYDDTITGSVCQLDKDYFSIHFEFRYSKGLIMHPILYLENYTIGKYKKLDILYYTIGISFLSSRNPRGKLHGPISENIKKLKSILTDEEKLLIELELMR